MRRLEPPSAARWILEHLTPPDRDEALAGDLEEDFRAGRSEGWYWRQVFGACANGWVQYIRGLLRGHTRKAAAAAAAAEQAALAAQPGATMFVPKLDAWSVKRFFALMLGAGLLNVWIAAILICRLPAVHAPSFRSLIVRAMIYVAIAGLAGTGGIWFYWSGSDSPLGADSPITFRLFALTAAVGWIWMPAVHLLANQDSKIAIPVAVLAAILLAVALRKTLPPMAVLTREETSELNRPPREFFEQSLFTVPQETYGFAIALCIYAAGYMLTHYMTFEASALLALAAFCFVWNWTLVPAEEPETEIGSKKKNDRAAKRLANIAMLAVLATVYALLTGINLRNAAEIAASDPGQSAGAGGNSRQKIQSTSAKLDLSGYQSIILWPAPSKTLIYAPPLSAPGLVPGSKQPLVIRFYGPYWYYQLPNKRPGPKAHQAYATPLGVNIAANNSIPLVMEAHQNVGVEIPLARCSEVQVGVESRDNDGATVSLAVFLSDSTAPNKPKLYLGQHSIMNSGMDFQVKTAPQEETLHFTVPVHARTPRFDEITVMFLTDPGHARVGPKIAIQQFALIPRGYPR